MRIGSPGHLVRLLLALGTAACDVGDSGAVPPRSVQVPDSAAASPEFSTLRPGDTLLGLYVDSVRIAPDPVDGFGWMGMVDFSGEVELTGEFRPHMDFPEVGEICFFVDAAAARKLPRFPNDQRRPWFCFSNQELAARLLGEPGQVGRARVTIDRFSYLYQHTDVFNRGRLTAAEVLAE